MHCAWLPRYLPTGELRGANQKRAQIELKAQQVQLPAGSAGSVIFIWNNIPTDGEGLIKV